MAVVLEKLLADRCQPDLTLAGVIVGGVFVNRTVVAVLVPAAVEVTGKENLAAEVQNAAPAALEVFRGGGFR